MMVIISGISLIGINQAFGFGCFAVGGNWNDPNTWGGCGGGVPDSTDDSAGITNAIVQLNNEFTISSLEIAEGGSLSVNGKLTTGNLFAMDSDLFINCNGELVLTDGGSNSGLITNHGIFRTLAGVPFSNTGTYQSSGTDIFGGLFSGNAIVPIASICPVCGDGIVNQPGEQCDPAPPGSLPTATCDIACQLIPFCGDGIVNQPSEQCDPAPPGSLPTATCDINCQPIPTGCQSDADCNDSNACTTDTCNTLTGQCSNTSIVCDDNDACNGLETCNTATGCVAGTPLVCDDGQFCTLDSCNTASGCVFAPNPDPACERVGGEFIGVDNSALLVAGFQANALWLLPAIAAIGIVAVVIRRIH